MHPEAEARVRAGGRRTGRRSVVLAALLVVSVMVGGCLVGPNYARPPAEPPEHFKSQADKKPAPEIAREWWRLYGDPELDQLIVTANASNQSLRQAVARVDEARALARVAGSYRFPTISVDPSYTYARESGTRASSITGQRVARGINYKDWLIPLDLTWELDIWGRIRRSFEAANATAAATAIDLDLVRLTIETDVARFYYALRSLDEQIQILAENITSYREQVRLLSSQFKSGLVSEIVVNQAQAQLQATLAQQQDAQRARADLEHTLAILCGRPAPSFAVAANPMHKASSPAVPPGLPAQILARRPDVAEAEQYLVATNAQIGVAIANFLPRFTLTGSAGFESGDVSSLFDWQSRLASIIPGISLPIFQGGRLRANLDATKARYQQALAAYMNQILIAYGDVEDALTDLHALSDEVATLGDAVSASESYLRLAQSQFKFGLIDYLIVIDAERTLLTNQLSRAQAVNLQMAASVHLIKALGGGWDSTSSPIAAK